MGFFLSQHYHLLYLVTKQASSGGEYSWRFDKQVTNEAIEDERPMTISKPTSLKTSGTIIYIFVLFLRAL